MDALQLLKKSQEKKLTKQASLFGKLLGLAARPSSRGARPTAVRPGTQLDLFPDLMPPQPTAKTAPGLLSRVDKHKKKLIGGGAVGTAAVGAPFLVDTPNQRNLKQNQELADSDNKHLQGQINQQMQWLNTASDKFGDLSRWVQNKPWQAGGIVGGGLGLLILLDQLNESRKRRQREEKRSEVRGETVFEHIMNTDFYDEDLLKAGITKTSKLYRN